MEQEFGLIIGRSGPKRDFFAEWFKYIPAILAYGERSRKRAMANAMLDLDLSGTYFMVHSYVLSYASQVYEPLRVLDLMLGRMLITIFEVSPISCLTQASPLTSVFWESKNS
jgi:hypothetical protein